MKEKEIAENKKYAEYKAKVYQRDQNKNNNKVIREANK